MLLVDSGTVTADGTEQQLSTKTPTVDSLYVLAVSAVNMLSGDNLELRLYKKMISSGNSYECVFFDNFPDAQSVNDIVKQSIAMAVSATMPMKATLKQTAGTNRSYKWELYSL